MNKMTKDYDVVIIGAGPGGIYTAYELIKNDKLLRVAVIDSGNSLNNRKCPAILYNTNCVHCETCSIMQGFGGAGAFSDGKYNITNDFGGNISKYIGEENATKLMTYVDSINNKFVDNLPNLFITDKNSELYRECLKNNLHLLSGNLRHLGTDNNLILLEKLYKDLSEYVDFYFNTTVESIEKSVPFLIKTDKGETFSATYCVVSAGRSGSKWVERICKELGVQTTSNNVDIGVRVELPYSTFAHITDELYESKIVYRTQRYQDLVRTFCMNPKGQVVCENTNGIITVNGHSFEDKNKQTNNTNFALLVSKHLTEPFNNSTEYGESIAKLSNMLGGGVIVQRFGDLIRGQRSTEKRISESFVKPTLKANPGDLSLVLPKRILDDIISMVCQLDKVAPGTANDDTLLYGVEVKFSNVLVDVDNNFESKIPNLYFIGDGSGISRSLSQASASGVWVATQILCRI